MTVITLVWSSKQDYDGSVPRQTLEQDEIATAADSRNGFLMTDSGHAAVPMHPSPRIPSRLDRKRVRAGVIVAALCAAYAVAFVDRSLVGIAGAPIKSDLALSDSQFGLLHGAAFVVLYCLCGVPLGWMADRLDRRMMIATGLLFWSVMTVFCGLAQSFSVFFIARIGVGLGEAILVPAGMSLLSSAVAKEKMAQSVAIFLMGAAIGNAVALLGGGYLLNRLSGSPPGFPFPAHLAPWQLLFLIAAVPGVVLAGIFALLGEPPRVAGAETRIGFWRSVSAAIAHMRGSAQAYGFLTAATACSIILAQAQAAWVPLLYVRKFGLSPGDSAIALGLMFLISAPTGQWAGGILIDRLQAAGVRAPSNLVLALCAAAALPAAFLFCMSDQLTVSRSAYLVFNFLVFAATPAGLTGWQLLTPERIAGMSIAILVSIVTLVGVGLGPALVGWLTDLVFQDEAALGRSLFVVIAVAGTACFGLALMGRTVYAEAVGRLSLRGSDDDPATSAATKL
jgi:MFS family permease